MKKKWSEEEIQIIRDNPFMTAKEVKELLPERSIHSIYNARRRWGVSNSTKLKDEDIEFIKENYDTMSSVELGEKLGVHRTTIERTLKKMEFMPLDSNVWYLNSASSSVEDGEFSVSMSFSKEETK